MSSTQESLPFQETVDELYQKFTLEIQISNEALQSLREEVSARISRMLEHFSGEELNLQEADEYLVVNEEVSKSWSDAYPTTTVEEIIEEYAGEYDVSIDSHTRMHINKAFSKKSADHLHDAAIVGEAEGKDEVTTTLLERICDLILDKDGGFPLFC